jgi:hypothetical protein
MKKLAKVLNEQIVQAYHKLMAAKDAERENDGSAMISIWRINMIDFLNNNHNKCLILGHTILSDMIDNMN